MYGDGWLSTDLRRVRAPPDTFLYIRSIAWRRLAAAYAAMQARIKGTLRSASRSSIARTLLVIDEPLAVDCLEVIPVRSKRRIYRRRLQPGHRFHRPKLSRCSARAATAIFNLTGWNPCAHGWTAGRARRPSKLTPGLVEEFKIDMWRHSETCSRQGPSDSARGSARRTFRASIRNPEHGARTCLPTMKMRPAATVQR